MTEDEGENKVKEVEDCRYCKFSSQGETTISKTAYGKCKRFNLILFRVVNNCKGFVKG